MSLLQKAVETYDAHASLAGVVKNTVPIGTDGKAAKAYQPLAPIGHTITSADIEITLDGEGHFCRARQVDRKEPKIILPVTEDSAGRTNTPAAHPLCEQVGYLSGRDEQKFTLYVEQLREWSESEYSHPMLWPILRYVEGRTLLADLAACGIQKVDDKQLICWQVNGLGMEKSGKCWEDQTLFRAYTAWYEQRRTREGSSVLCMVSGDETIPARQHAKGIIPVNGNAKLISANDTRNFTYRGRFTEDSQAATVGYEASQKAHNALRWLAAEQGTVYGGRTFLCWNPKGKAVHRPELPFLGNLGKPPVTPTDYRKELQHTLEGFRADLPENDADVVIASFDAATTGRLALTYYRELRESDFLQRLYDWDESCCWWGWNPEDRRYNAVQSPPLCQIVQCAFGIRREEKGKVRLTVDDCVMRQQIQRLLACRIEREEKGKVRLTVDDRMMRQQIQRLLACRIERAVFPADILRALTARASMPQAFDGVYQTVLITACAAIKKYYHDHGKGEIEMALERNRDDISYQFGRLLAVLEKVERDTYDKEETREPNAIRLQSAYCKRPMHTAKIIETQLERAYFPRLRPSARGFYKGLIAEIMERIAEHSNTEWNQPLGDTYLVGYYLQRKELYTSREEKKEENRQ